MKRLFRSLLCLTLPIVLCAPLFAHQDTIITIKNNELVGLPKEYQPAELDLKEYRLRIKDHVMEFCPFIKSLFPDGKPYDLSITSSWYHDRSILPPYISLDIRPQGKNVSHRILFNLDTLDVIEVSKVIRDERTTQFLPIELSELQKQDIKRSISTVKKEQN